MDPNQGFGIVNRWKEFSEDKIVVRLDSSFARYIQVLTSFKVAGS